MSSGAPIRWSYKSHLRTNSASIVKREVPAKMQFNSKEPSTAKLAKVEFKGVSGMELDLARRWTARVAAIPVSKCDALRVSAASRLAQ